MRAVLPGKAQAKLQAVTTAQWQGRRIVAYISGSALVILAGSHVLLQTIYHDESESLDAVAIDEASGKIASCSGPTVHVYRPYGQEESALKWSLQCSLTVDLDAGCIATLSWGAAEELLVGGSSLVLFSTAQTESAIWTRKLANPVRLAQCSYDAALIATTGQYESLVKVWRRLSFGSDDVRFDFTYLPHPTTVTGLHWRRPYHREQTLDNILYTLCADNVLRIWAATEPHGLQILQLWAQLDLQESIKPRLSADVRLSSKRYAFIIDSRDFGAATERAVQAAGEHESEHQALHHLVEVARRSPEVCVVVDDKGRMSAWGFENVGCRARKTTNVFNIAHVEGLRLHFNPNPLPDEDYVQFSNFCGEAASSAFTLLAHHFDGRIEWLEGSVDGLFDPSPRSERLACKALWTGHAGSIKKINRTVSGNALVSRTHENETILWTQKRVGTGTTLVRQSEIRDREHVSKTCVLDEGRRVVALQQACLSMWDTTPADAIKLASLHFDLKGSALCLISLPSTTPDSSVAYVATISSELKGIAWEVRLQSPTPDDKVNGVTQSSSDLRQLATFELGSSEDFAFVLPVDPAGSVPFISGFVDTFARDVAISCTHAGILTSWTAKVDLPNSTVHWLSTATVETGIVRPSLASGSSIRKTALVDEQRTGLTIWDTRGGRLEFDRRFEAQDVIQDLDWTSTPDDQSILAVGFPHRVLLLAQLRYDYLDAGPAWELIREIRIRDLTPHPIGDSIWLDSGNFVIGAGNQLFVYDKQLDVTDKLVTELRLPLHQPASIDLFNVVARLNGPLPVFHPQFLSQCILRGRLSLVQKILVKLYSLLKFFTDGDQLDNLLSLPIEVFFIDDEVRESPRLHFSSDRPDDNEEVEVLTEELAASLNETMTKVKIPQLSGQEQFHLADIVECCATVEKHRRSMDDNASRFLLFFRQHSVRKGQSGVDQVAISWREITWAYHSNSQDILIDLVSRQFQGRMTWEHAKESGMFMWIKDVTALRAQFEAIARNQYTRTDEKNPIDCSLYYFALRKKNVLMGLWRMASWNREQRATQKLLANNFQEAKWKTAALKNAYALLGRHRFEYAAAFFLLADCLKDAVNVCINQLDDIQLAIAVARVYGGDDGPVLREILEDKVLPQAARDGNRWLATWAFWMLNQRDKAVRALISPIHTLLDSSESPGLQAKSYLTDDPALVVFYKQLREKTLQTLRGASRISPQAEWDFVVHNAQLYDRMGCDLLALELVRNWEFLKQPAEKHGSLGETLDPRRVLRRRSSLVVADLPSPKLPTEMKSGGTKPSPTVFEEPDATSLLSNFGY